MTYSSIEVETTKEWSGNSKTEDIITKIRPQWMSFTAY